MRDVSEDEVSQITRLHNIGDLTARSLAARGVSARNAPEYLDPKIRTLMPDPSVLADMNKAAQQVARAIADNRIIGIIADFDVDGITSLSLLRGFLREVGNEPVVHVPCRIEEGYGPSRAAIERMQREQVEILITLDCGTTAGGTLALAAEQGMEVIVLDHHQTDEVHESISALVNPNRPDDTSDLAHLAACGVVMIFLVALRRSLIELPDAQNLVNESRTLAEVAQSIDLLQYLDLVALGTMCDVVPLIGINRAFVRQGVRLMQNRPRRGIAELLEFARVRPPLTPRHLAFSLGPRINAAGRLGEVGVAIKMFDEAEDIDHRSVAARLNELNYHRQKLESAIVVNATHLALPQVEAGRKVICVADDHWHRGVLGLVAGRIRMRFNRPTLAVTFIAGTRANGAQGDVLGVGSARGVTDGQGNEAGFRVNIGAMVRKAVELGILESGGGHFAAAGFRVFRSKWQDLCAFVEDYATHNQPNEVERQIIWLDGIVDGAVPDHQAIVELNDLGPFGAANEEPLFFMPDQQVIEHNTFGDGHISCSLHGYGGVSRAVCFRAAENNLLELLRAGERLHIAAAFDTGAYGPQVRIIDASSRTM